MVNLHSLYFMGWRCNDFYRFYSIKCDLKYSKWPKYGYLYHLDLDEEIYIPFPRNTGLRITQLYI